MRSGTERFGAQLRLLREKQGFGLRELARETGISPAFLSKIEAGKENPPADAKIRALAKAVCCEWEKLLAIAGRVPLDVLRVIQRHPCEYFDLIRAAKRLSAEELRTLQQKVSARRNA